MTGTVSGVALAPGVSLNGRLYTKDNITKAYERLNARINDPNSSPVVMRTHHGAGDDSTRIVAQVNKVTLDPDCTLRYFGNFADTEHAQAIRSLAKPDDDSGKPALAHVSIFGWWTEEPTTVEFNGQKVETADDLEIDFIDFTASPGVTLASASAESTSRPYALHESHDVEITVTETQPAVIDAPDAKRYADPGFRDGVKRLPVDTIEQVHQARAWIALETNQQRYTGPQVNRIRKHTEAAARKLGAKVNREGWIVSGRPVEEAAAQEYYADLLLIDDDVCQPASFCFDASNGPINICISSWCLDPADLEVVVQKACAAITLALQGFDPDMDGDLDVEADDVIDGADQMETKPTGTAVTETATADPAATATETEAAATARAETSTPKEPAMAESTTTGAPATEVAAPEIDYAKLAEALAPAIVSANAKAEEDRKAAEEKATAEAATKAETATATEAQLREAMKEAARELLLEGTVSAHRKGAGLSEQTSADPTPAELWEKRGEVMLGVARDNAQRYGNARV